MSIETNYANAGLISQNYDVISNVNKKYARNTIEDLQTKSSGKMTEISDEELRAIRQKEQNEAKTLNVDNSEIINDFFSKTGDNITYNVDGVMFSNKEMKACKEVLKNAISGLPAKGSALDYKDYATMGIAANIVGSYAKENLTEEQAEVVNRSLEEYFNNLIQAEEERQNSQGYFVDDADGVGNTGKLNTFYNVRHTSISSEAAETLRSQLSNLPEHTKNTLLANLDSVEKNGSVVQSASNKEFAGIIKALFQNSDLKDENVVNDVLKQYKNLMMPVYKAYGLQNNSNSDSLAHVLEQDVNKFSVLISNMKAVSVNVGSSLNCSA